MSEISLSAGVRLNLLSLQQTSTLLAATQQRLATGKRVNSALDNPQSFFTAEALNSRATQLSSTLDGVSSAVRTIEAADNALEGVNKILESAKAVLAQMLGTTDTTIKDSLGIQYQTLQNQINGLTEDAGYNGTNLVKTTPDTLKVIFNELTGANLNSLEISGKDMTVVGLGLTDTSSAAFDNTTTTTLIQGEIDKITNAFQAIRTYSSQLGSNLSVVEARQSFLTKTINTLESGADSLVLADNNLEGANLLALRTRSELSQTALSLASQQDQAVLKLFT